jgi:hypothetical protein
MFRSANGHGIAGCLAGRCEIDRGWSPPSRRCSTVRRRSSEGTTPPDGGRCFSLAVATSKVSRAEQEQRILEFANLRRISAMFDGCLRLLAYRPAAPCFDLVRPQQCHFACSNNSSLIIVSSAPIRRALSLVPRLTRTLPQSPRSGKSSRDLLLLFNLSWPLSCHHCGDVAMDHSVFLAS